MDREIAEAFVREELDELALDPVPEVRVVAGGDTLMPWFAVNGGANTAYADKVYVGNLVIPFRYPLRPPSVFFHRGIYHPNILKTSGCLLTPMLLPLSEAKSEWDINFTLHNVFQHIHTVLNEPRLDFAANVSGARLYRLFPDQFRQEVDRLYERQRR